MDDLSAYAFADDITVVSSSWDTLALAYAICFINLVPLPTFVSISVNVSSGIKAILTVTTHPILINLPFAFTLSYWAHRLMLVFLMVLHFQTLTKLYCFVLSVLLSYLYLICCFLSLVHFFSFILLYPFCSLLWYELFPKLLLLNTQSLLSLFPKVANGCPVKLYLPWLPQVTFCFPISFSIIGMLLSICCMLGRQMHNNALIFPNYGMILSIWNGDPFFVCVPLLNILALCLKIFLF